MTVSLPVVSCTDPPCGACCTHADAPPGGYPVYAALPPSSWPAWAFDHPDLLLWQDVPEAARRELAARCGRMVGGDGSVRQADRPCVWLDLDTRRCRWYDHRPELCRRFEPGGVQCLKMRDEMNGVKPEPPAAVTLPPPRPAPPEPRTVLHVGCGPRPDRVLHWSFKGWRQLTVDVDPAVGPDIVASVTSMPDVGDASVEAVQASHMLEHLFPHEVPRALGEFLRVLRPDGDVLIQVPDIVQACAAIAEGRGDRPLYQAPGGPITPMDMVFGYSRCVERSPAMAHRTGFWAARLRQAVEAAGFAAVKVWNDQFDLFCVGQKPLIPAAPDRQSAARTPRRAAKTEEFPLVR